MHNAEPMSGTTLKVESALRYPFTPPKTDGLSMVEVAEGVQWVRMPMPMSLDHINVYLLRDGAGWAVVDTGLGLPTTYALWEQMFSEVLAGQPLTRIICTHCHYDHAGAAGWLQQRFGVPLLMTYGEFMMQQMHQTPPPDPLPDAHLAFYAHAGVPAELCNRMFDALRKDPFIGQAPVQYQRMREGDVLEIGARRWQVVRGEGHSPEHASLYDAEGRVLLAGDQLLPIITSNVMVTPFEPEGNPLRQWLLSLERLRELHPETLVLPSHQGVFYGLRERVDEIVAHHHEQFTKVREHLRASPRATALELMQVLFPRLRGAVDQMMALGETMAHLNYLRHSDQLTRVRDADQVDWYGLPTVATTP